MALTKIQIEKINAAVKEYNKSGSKVDLADIIKKIDLAKDDSYIDLYKDMLKDFVKNTNANLKNGINYKDEATKFDIFMTNLYDVKFRNVEQKPFNSEEYEEFLEDLFNKNPILVSDNVANKAGSLSKADKLIARMNEAYIEIDSYLERDKSLHEKEAKVKVGMFGKRKSNKTNGPSEDLFSSIIEQAAPAYKALKDEYNGRSFIKRWFTLEGYHMRKAIKECELKLQAYNEKLGSPLKEDISTVLDRKALEQKDLLAEETAKDGFRRSVAISNLEIDDESSEMTDDDLDDYCIISKEESGKEL